MHDFYHICLSSMLVLQVEPVDQFHQNIVSEVSGAAPTLSMPPGYEGQKQKNVQELMDVDFPAHSVDPSSVSIPVQSSKSSESGAMVEVLNGANKPAASVLNTSSPTAPFVPYPVINLAGDSTDAKASAAGSTAVPVSAAANPEGGSNMDIANEAEEALLKELAEMGFKQVDLNKEVLRKNEYDLQQSVDDLCSASEWDTILEELREMVSLSLTLSSPPLLFTRPCLFNFSRKCCICRVFMTEKPT